MTLGDLVKNYREKCNISMDEFSKTCGLSKGYISMLENNINPRNNKPIAPTLPTIKKIASAMNTDVDFLLKALDSDQEINLISDVVLMDMAKRIKERRIFMGYTQAELGEKIGVQASAIAKYENGRVENIKRSVIANMANVLDCSPAYLMGWNEPTKKKGVVINVLGRVAAGIPIEAIEDIIDTEEISEEMARTGDFFGLQIHGDSMQPRICDGDVVIVRQQEDAETGDIVIALVNGDDATCKRLKKYHDGIELIPNNPTFEPLFFSYEEIKNKPVKIIGKVVELRAKL